MASKQVAILGLGDFGEVLARALEEYGVEVLAVDMIEEVVDHIAPYVTKAVTADVTDPLQLEEIGIREFDIVVVALSQHFEESVLCTLNLKELGIKQIIVKARTDRMETILKRVGADRIVNSDKDMAIKVAKSLLRRSIVEMVELDENYSIAEVSVNSGWVDRTLQQLNLRKTMKMNIIGIRSLPDRKMNMDFDGDYVIKNGDSIVVVAPTKKIERWDYLMKVK